VCFIVSVVGPCILVNATGYANLCSINVVEITRLHPSFFLIIVPNDVETNTNSCYANVGWGYFRFFFLKEHQGKFPLLYIVRG
jgi:hypothetical protein